MRKQIAVDFKKIDIAALLKKGGDFPLMLLQSSSTTEKQLLAYGAIASFSSEGTLAMPLIEKHLDASNDWWFGYLGYDLKNELENLHSSNIDGAHFPTVQFFRPEYVIEVNGGSAYLYFSEEHTSEEQALSFVRELENPENREAVQSNAIELVARQSKEDYLTHLDKVLKHIRFGNIYEVNYCQEFYAENATMDAVNTYFALKDKTQAPFCAYGKFGEHHLLCGSPERYLKKEGELLTSQPIKGTAPRGKTVAEDKLLKEQLEKDPKERAENTMIVDLVRNDLSKVAQANTVNVEEWCGIYSFETVHQMISTVTAKTKKDVTFSDTLRATFPMGSMTGAPKISAMHIIEEEEVMQRGIYSGAVGYIRPNGDFDFNVVIRSIAYNAATKYVSVMAGGAITAASDPEKEYAESLLKAEAMRSVLNEERR